MHQGAGEARLERSLVELASREVFHLAEVERTIDRDELHGRVGELRRAPWHVVQPHRGEALTEVIDERHRDGAPRGAVGSSQDLVAEFPGAGFATVVGLAPQVGDQVALVCVSGATGDDVVGRTVEWRVRRHHEREVRIEEGGLACAGCAGDERRLRRELDGVHAVEPAPVD